MKFKYTLIEALKIKDILSCLQIVTNDNNLKLHRKLIWDVE